MDGSSQPSDSNTSIHAPKEALYPHTINNASTITNTTSSTHAIAKSSNPSISSLLDLSSSPSTTHSPPPTAPRRQSIIATLRGTRTSSSINSSTFSPSSSHHNTHHHHPPKPTLEELRLACPDCAIAGLAYGCNAHRGADVNLPRNDKRLSMVGGVGILGEAMGPGAVLGGRPVSVEEISGGGGVDLRSGGEGEGEKGKGPVRNWLDACEDCRMGSSGGLCEVHWKQLLGGGGPKKGVEL
ncbi:hypothetical protein HDV00_005945 [Rhizophlyctis rosea]|nr:hypothetical protein HDV00_005945 [Rhizophlyctis rosea]